ncbi:hypothetical protein DM558_10290 [Entomomonas moraniae]|uniref:TNase-like domain-containing protein n=1 Tax=Entomomonas moraniae TaxID=2213226 RepID=A0A3Q9JM12_9GAMM|nr:thermonuclease family protein [Entomomonas moraniae]AZS51133.1 hypothetical protein DM558_10290 [Entomomonas moraniae]
MDYRVIQIFLLTMLLITFSTADYAESLMCKVDKIIDIKTIVCVQPNNEDDLLIKNTVALDQIDTVRIWQHPFFFQARELMNQLMVNQLIFIDVKESNEKYREIYAEQPTHYKLWVNGVVYASDVNINLELVENGFATVAMSDEKIDNSYYQAKNNKRGLWSADPIITPRQFDDNWQKWQKELPKVLKIPEIIVCQIEKITNTERFYCYYQDENGLNVKSHIDYYQVWMP